MKKTWKLVIGIETFYLTDREKDFYLSSVAKGAKYVQVNDLLMLGANFQSLQHEEIQSERQNIEEGRYKCKYGRWHREGWACMCAPMKFDAKTQKFIQDPETEIEKAN